MVKILRILLLGGALAALSGGLAYAQPYPTRPIKILVGFSPGGSADIAARAYAAELQKSLGQPVVVENRAGADGAIATAILAKLPPDGYNLVLVQNSTVTGPLLSKNIPYDIWQDFAHVALVASVPIVLVCNPSLPVSNVRQLIALAKSKPGDITYGSSGSGSIMQLAMELMNANTGITMTHVPYKGGAPVMTAVMAGEVSCAWVSLAQSRSFIQSGKVKALAIGTANRDRTLPDLPTALEAGIPNYVVDVWFGFSAPAGTPAAVVSKLNAELNRIAKTPEIQERFPKVGLLPRQGTPAEFEAFMRANAAMWGDLIKRAQIKTE